MRIDKKNISIFTIWLVHISGFMGMVFYDLDLFATFTPLNLALMLIILIVNMSNIVKQEILSIFSIFFIGMLAEGLGVNYGLIFGKYDYGNNLGFKLFGVPFLIGINWIMLTIISGSIASCLFKTERKFLTITCGALLMLAMDFVMEPIAPKLDLWQFENLVVPLSNYFGWFIIGLITQTIYKLQFLKKEISVSSNLYIAFFLFFSLLNLFI